MKFKKIDAINPYFYLKEKQANQIIILAKQAWWPKINILNPPT